MTTKMIAGIISMAAAVVGASGEVTGRWSVEQARSWHESTGWLVGCNFSPSTAINQLEMWQADSFDRETIERELDWVASLGFNSVRVYLHSLAWRNDPEGFLRRTDAFLDMAESRKIGVMLVLFDSCWHPFPKAGPQPAPVPFVHNSGWVQDPGIEALKDPAAFAALEAYVHAVVKRFATDRRIHVWDVWNEPDNCNEASYGDIELKDKPERIPPLLAQVFAWARAAKPSQPLTSGVWLGEWDDDAKLNPTAKVQLENSDVISFHAYGKADHLRARIAQLRRFNRPLLCTEYMARPNGSNFDPNLGIMKDEKIGAYNWGFVAGKTQTIFPWDSWKKKYEAEPPVWFHDIFRPDGTPYRAEEVTYIRSLTLGQ